jgi:hypothetical protein
MKYHYISIIAAIISKLLMMLTIKWMALLPVFFSQSKTSEEKSQVDPVSIAKATQW